MSKFDLKVNDVAEEYIEFLGRLDNSSEYSIRSVYENHINPLLGQKTISSIKRKDMRLLQRELINKTHRGRKYSNVTINNITTIFNTILNFAVEYEYIPANPCVKFPSLRVVKIHDKVAFWTDDEFKQAIVHEKSTSGIVI